MAEQERKVSLLLTVGIVFMPYIFGWLLFRNGYSKKAKMLGFGWTAIVIVILLSQDNKPTDKVNQTQVSNVSQAEPVIKNSIKPNLSLRDRIDDYVFTKYKKSQYPKSFAKFGSRMADVEKARQAAAFLALASDKCSRVEMSEVSDSSTRDNIKIFTDCYDDATKSSERFRFEESELKDGKKHFFSESTASSAVGVKTMMEQAFSQESAIAICRESVLKLSKFPSSVNFATFGQAVNTSQGSGETWVELEFEAKNGVGAELPYKASCSFPLHGEPTVSITNR